MRTVYYTMRASPELGWLEIHHIDASFFTMISSVVWDSINIAPVALLGYPLLRLLSGIDP